MVQENDPLAQGSHPVRRAATRKPQTTLVGFLGRHVVRALAEQHYRLRIAVRHPYFIDHLQRLGRPGQIRAVRADVRFPRLVEAAVRDAEVVINLVGILSEREEQRFDAVQGKGAKTVARAAAGVRSADSRLGHRCGRKFACSLCSIEGTGGGARVRRGAGSNDLPTVHRVRTRR